MATLFEPAEHLTVFSSRKAITEYSHQSSKQLSILTPALQERLNQRKKNQSICKKGMPLKFLGSILVSLSRKRQLSLEEGFKIWHLKRNTKEIQSTIDELVTKNRVSQSCFFYRLKIYCKKEQAQQRNEKIIWQEQGKLKISQQNDRKVQQSQQEGVSQTQNLLNNSGSLAKLADLIAVDDRLERLSKNSSLISVKLLAMMIAKKRRKHVKDAFQNIQIKAYNSMKYRNKFR